MRHAFLDCFSGVSGDMLLGALIDAGWPEAKLKSLPEKLGLENTVVEVEEVKRQGLRGIQVKVCGPVSRCFRNIGDVEDILNRADLRPEIIRTSLEVFNCLAKVEAKVHGCPLDEVHFHEIGAVDTLVDIVGTISGLAHFSVERLFCSPLPLTRGWIDCDHGRLPLPAPACAELLRNMPVYWIDGEGELVTPTGCALVKVLANDFGAFPEICVDKIGYGAGSRDMRQHANLLRIWLSEARASAKESVVVELRTNIDDMNPEWYEYLMERLFSAGALDIVMSPVYMKKNRPGIEIAVIAPSGHEHGLSQILFEESTTSGIRLSRCMRYVLPRRIGTVPTPWGNIRAKLITRPGGRDSISPEYEACKDVAQRFSVPLSTVYQTVSQAPAEDFVDKKKDAVP